MIRKTVLIVLAGFMLSAAQARETNTTPRVYIIPIRKMIEPALLYVVRRGVDEAVRNNVDAIILNMNTTGGRVDSAIAVVGAGGISPAKCAGRINSAADFGRIGEVFGDWGMSLVDSIRQIRAVSTQIPLIAGGGVRHILRIRGATQLAATG